MGETCTDSRFEIIEKAKKDILEYTNIDTSPEEMKVLDNILFRCWQMGWLTKYDETKTPTNDGMYMEFFAVKDGKRYYNSTVSLKDMCRALNIGIMDTIEKVIMP
jgi:hypothetical protein